MGHPVYARFFEGKYPRTLYIPSRSKLKHTNKLKGKIDDVALLFHW